MEAFRSAVEGGVSPVEFWNLTPYLTWQATAALRDRAVTQIWMAAALTRAKKLPELAKLLSKGPEDKKDVAAKLKAALMSMKRKEVNG